LHTLPTPPRARSRCRSGCRRREQLARRRSTVPRICRRKRIDRGLLNLRRVPL